MVPYGRTIVYGFRRRRKKKTVREKEKKGNQHEHPNHKRPSHIRLHEAHSWFLGIQPGPNIVDKLCTSLIVHWQADPWRPSDQRPQRLGFAFPVLQQQQRVARASQRDSEPEPEPQPQTNDEKGQTAADLPEVGGRAKGPIPPPRRLPRSCHGALAPSTPADSVHYGLLLLRARFAPPLPRVFKIRRLRCRIVVFSIQLVAGWNRFKV